MDLLSLVANLSLDASEYEKGLAQSGQAVKSFGNAFSKVLGMVAKVGVAALGAATTATAFLAKSAISSYAEYEQLVGGVSKLYGTAGQTLEEYAASVGKTTDEVKDKYASLMQAEELMAKNAQKAYMTAGMSANQYMETATGFSAALINSLGGDTVKAAELTDVAMRAMSDNVNTFGSSMDSVQMAFQGFAKQNYTMLDNLKLGYGGTKEEMQRLIDDANEYRKSIGESSDLSIDSFADIITAIEAVQEKQNIAGTTNREAMKTIEGSANATKAAWENVITAIGRGEGLEEAMSNLTTAIFGTADGEGLLNQLLPRIQTVFEGIGEFISAAAPYITGKLPGLVSSIVPQMLKAGTSLLSVVSSTLPTMVQQLFSSLAPQVVSASKSLFTTLSTTIGPMIQELFGESSILQDIFNSGIELIGKFTEGIRTYLPELIPVAMEMLLNLTSGLRENFGTLFDSAMEMLLAIADGIIQSLPVLIETVPTIIENIAGLINDNAPKLIVTGLTIIKNLVVGIIQNIPVIIQNIPKIFSAIVAVWSAFNWINLGKQVITFIGNGIKSLATAIPQFLRDIAQNGGNIIRNFGWASFGRAIIQLLVNGVRALASSIPSALRSIASAAARSFIGFSWSSTGRQIINGIANGIRGAAGKIVEAAKNAAKRAFEAAKNFLGIKSPSRLFRDKIGKMMAEGMAIGFDEGINDDDYTEPIDDIVGGIEDIPYDSIDPEGDGSASTSERSLIYALLLRYLPELANMQWVIYPDVMAAELTPYVDENLGIIATRKGRA